MEKVAGARPEKGGASDPTAGGQTPTEVCAIGFAYPEPGMSIEITA